MAISLYDRRVMIRSLEQLYEPETWFLDTFCKETEQSQTQYIDIDIIKGGRVMAPIVHPTGKGSAMSRYGFVTESVKAPYCKPKLETTAEDLLKRQVGETIYSPSAAPAVMAQRQMGKDLKLLKDSIVRREEWMIATALQNGVVPLVGKNVNQTVDFLFDVTHILALLGADLWDAFATSLPQKNLRDWKRTLRRDSGLVPDICVLGSDVVDAFYVHLEQDTGLAKVLDNRRVIMGQIQPQELPDGVTYLGNLEGLDLYSYDSWYQDQTGALFPMMNPKKIILGSTRARCVRHYGAVRHLSATAIVPYYPVMWDEIEDGVKWLMVMAGILPAIHQPDAFMVITAVT